uniref:Uncharacterized protein n=1 Tax=Anguilla anguilla TaxID=7936 RepID=A0A0E9QX48_ANGAN
MWKRHHADAPSLDTSHFLLQSGKDFNQQMLFMRTLAKSLRGNIINPYNCHGQ